MQNVKRELLDAVGSTLDNSEFKKEQRGFQQTERILNENPEILPHIAFAPTTSGVYTVIQKALAIDARDPVVARILDAYEGYGSRLPEMRQAYPLDHLIALRYDDVERMNEITVKTLRETAKNSKPYEYEFDGIYFQHLLEYRGENAPSLAEKIFDHYKNFSAYLKENPETAAQLRAEGVNLKFWDGRLDYKGIEKKLKGEAGHAASTSSSRSIGDIFSAINKEPESCFVTHPANKAPSMSEYCAQNVLQPDLRRKIDIFMARQKFNGAVAKTGMDLTRNRRLHLVFNGGPGTGKTTLARVLGRYFKEIGLLEKGQVVETTAATLTGKYVGHTVPKVRKAVEEAKGGILLIDEIYHFNDDKFGPDAVNELIAQMENKREDFILIVAGYPDENQEFIKLNPGLRDRFGSDFPFNAFGEEEMKDIIRLKLDSMKLSMDDDALAAMVRYLEEDKRQNPKLYANARTAEILLDAVIDQRAVRFDREGDSEDSKDLLKLRVQDVYAAIADKKTSLSLSSEPKQRIGF